MMATPDAPIRHPRKPKVQHLRRVFLSAIVGIGVVLPAATSCSIALAPRPPNNGCPTPSTPIPLKVYAPTSVLVNKAPVSQTRLQRLLHADNGVLFDRQRSVHVALPHPYVYRSDGPDPYGLIRRTGPVYEMSVREFDGPDYQVSVTQCVDPIGRGAAAPLDYAALGFSNVARNTVGEPSKAGMYYSFLFVTRSGDEIMYISNKELVQGGRSQIGHPQNRAPGNRGEIGPNSTVPGSGSTSARTLTRYPSFVRYSLTPLIQASGGPVAVRVDFDNGWVWLIPLRDGDVDPSRLAIAVQHNIAKIGQPTIKAFRVAS